MSNFIISNLVDKFIFYLEYEKNSSPKTLENYSLWLNRFINYIWDIEINSLKKMQILDYRMFLNSLKLSKKTINYHIVAIRSFLKFCLKNDIECLNPEKLELSKIPPREIKYLTEDELKKILQAPLNFNKNILKQKRDTAILYFLFWTWLRVTELINVKRIQIKTDSKQFSVIWKWSKMRSVFMTKIAMEKLNDYLKIRDDNFPYLFINISNNWYWNKLTRNSIEEIVRKYSKLAWIDKKVTPHVLRHSFATSLIKKWADIRAVQTLLWHSSITTTQIYTHVDDKYLKEIHNLLDKE